MSLYVASTCDNKLYHTGIKGMHWGVRRTHDKYGGLTKSGANQSIKLKQEYDRLSSISTLSDKGKQRKTEVQQRYKKLTGKSINPPKSNKSDEPKKKVLDDMTNEELQAYNTRRQLENNYLNGQPKPKYPHGKSVHEMSNEELKVYNDRKALEATYLGYQPKQQISTGKKFVNYAMSKVIGPAVTEAGKAYLTKTLKGKLGVKDLPKAAKSTPKKKTEDPTKDIVKALMKNIK